MADLMELRDLIHSLDCFTEAEEQLVASLLSKEHRALVVGDSSSGVFDLLEVFGLSLSGLERKPLGFSIECSFDQTVSLAAVCNQEHGIHHFDNTEALYKNMGDHLDDVTELRITAPSPLLKERPVSFRQLNHVSRDDLTLAASGYDSMVLVLDAGAGSLSDEVSAFCQWVKEVRMLSNRTAVILNHTETGAVNDLLGFLAGGMLDAKPESFDCDYEIGPEEALANAIFAAEAGAAVPDEKIAAACIRRLEDMLAETAAQLAHTEADHRQTAEKIQKLATSFRLYSVKDSYRLRDIVTPEQQLELKQDIQNMVDSLCKKLPKMVDDVVIASKGLGEDPKANLKNLAGDYVTALLNRYIGMLAKSIYENILQKQAEAVYRDMIAEFNRLVRDAKLDTVQSAAAETDYINAVDVNLGDVRTALAKTVGFLAPHLLNIAGFLLDLASDGFLVPFIRSFLRGMGSDIQIMAEDAVELVTPARSYGNYLTNVLIQSLAPMPKQLMEVLTETLIPSVEDLLVKQYTQRVEDTCGQLETLVAEELHQAGCAHHRRIVTQSDLLKLQPYKI